MLKKIEIRVFDKFIALKNAQVISAEQAQNALNDYNNFVLHVTIFRWNRSEAVRQLARKDLANFLAVYRKTLPVVAQEETAPAAPVQPIVTEVTPVLSPVAPAVTAPTYKKVGEVYPITKALYIGSRGDGVKNLQNILKFFGYMAKNIDSTGYYGDITKEAVIRFSKEVLKISNPDGTIPESIRKKLMELPLLK